MNPLTIIDPRKDGRWDAFVESHPFGWICHLSGWKEVLEKSFRHMKGYYLILLNGQGDISAALPIFEVNSWLTGNRLVSIPFATLCDPLISKGEDMEPLLDEARRLLKSHHGSYIEVRTSFASDLVRADGLGIRQYYKHHYLELKKDPEELKRSFHRSCVRQRIARALKSNLTLKQGEDESDLLKFYHLYVVTRKRLCLPPQPYAFLKSIWEVFSPSGKAALLMAEQEGHPLAGLILFKFKNRVSAEFAGSDERFYDLSPNHFLFWEAIKLAYKEGYAIFDFGRTAPSNETLMDFKSRWGTAVKDLPHYYYPKEASQGAEEEERSLGYRLVKKACATTPERALPYLGRFCYRHLG